MTNPTIGVEAPPPHLQLVRPPAAESPPGLVDGEVAVTPPASSADVIDLREAGRGYAAIARELTMPSSVQAQMAFLRAVRRCPEEERIHLVERGLGRLGDLDRNPAAAGQDAKSGTAAGGGEKTALRPPIADIPQRPSPEPRPAPELLRMV